MDIASSAAAANFYSAALAASQPTPADAPIDAALGGAQEEAGFVQAMGAVAQETVDTLMAGEETAKAMMAGKADAQAVVEALAATEMALEMAVAVRDKVVEAYQEILRMPV